MPCWKESNYKTSKKKKNILRKEHHAFSVKVKANGLKGLKSSVRVFFEVRKSPCTSVRNWINPNCGFHENILNLYAIFNWITWRRIYYTSEIASDTFFTSGRSTYLKCILKCRFFAHIQCKITHVSVVLNGCSRKKKDLICLKFVEMQYEIFMIINYIFIRS